MRGSGSQWDQMQDSANWIIGRREDGMDGPILKLFNSQRGSGSINCQLQYVEGQATPATVYNAMHRSIL